ncbi:MAG: tetratricopeptide repeat protein, partial [Oxalobacter sp.]
MEKQTLELYRLYRLASQGDADAQYRLGMRYLNGIGTPQDIRLAYIWIGKAADRNHEQAKQDLEHLRTAGIEQAAIAAGIPTDAGIADSAVPAPAGYVQTETELSERFQVSASQLESGHMLSVETEQAIQPVQSVQSTHQGNQTPIPAPVPASYAVPIPVQDSTVPASSAKKAVPSFRQYGKTSHDDTGATPMKKVFWGVMVLVGIVVAGWFFKGGSFWESGKTVEDKPVNSKAVILTDKDQKLIAQKVFDKHYGEGTYKNGCWMTEENACMKFKQVNAVPVKGSSLYNLYVYAYSTTGPGRIDAYTVEV